MNKTITTMLLAMIIPFSQQVMAHDYKEYKKSELHESRDKLKLHIKTKYGSKINIENIAIKQTPYGPQGSIYLDVDHFGPKPVSVPHESKEEKEQHARKVARQFIEDEKELLGVYDFEEVRETRISSGKENYGEFTRLFFKLYINGYELYASDYDLTIGSDDKIFAVSARLIPVSLTMYEATQQKALSDVEIIDIVINDLKAEQSRLHKDYNKNSVASHPFVNMNKVLIDKPPYAVWEIHDTYVYIINAVTGQIVSKTMNIVR